MILEHFKRKKNDRKKTVSVDTNSLMKCPQCEKMIFKGELDYNKTCNYCGGYFKMNPRERIASISDKNSFVEYFKSKKIKNPLNFPEYGEKQEKMRKTTGEDDGVVCGICKIEGIKTVIAVMNPEFMMGSMGLIVGEKIAKSIELSMKKKLPIVIFTASGGARMQEGMFSLMQMAKTSQAMGRHREKGILSICVLTDPTTGGVSASFANLGDIVIGEKNALIGFAGQRVISQVTGTVLPEGFQRADFLLEHGLLDMVVPREEMRETIGRLLMILGESGKKDKKK